MPCRRAHASRKLREHDVAARRDAQDGAIVRQALVTERHVEDVAPRVDQALRLGPGLEDAPAAAGIAPTPRTSSRSRCPSARSASATSAHAVR